MYIKYRNRNKTSYWKVKSDGVHSTKDGQVLNWDQFIYFFGPDGVEHEHGVHVNIITEGDMFLENI